MSTEKADYEYFRAACAVLVKSVRGRQKEIEAKTKLPKTTISFIINGKRPANSEQQAAIAATLGMTLPEMLDAGKKALDSGELFNRRAKGVEDRVFVDGLINPEEMQRDDSFVFVPFLDPVRDGGDLTYIQSDESYLAFQRAWLSAHGMALDMAIWRVRDVAMQPAIYQKDVALIDTGDILVNPGRIYLVRYENDFKLCRINYQGEGEETRMRLDFDNPAAASIDVKASGGFEVVGRLVWLGRVALNL